MSNTTPDSADGNMPDRFAMPPLAGVTDVPDPIRAGYEPASTEPAEEAPADVVAEDIVPAPLSGVADALDVLDRLSAAATTNGHAPDLSAEVADEWVFATAAQTLSDAAPPVTAVTPYATDATVDDQLPDFFRSDGGSGIRVEERYVPAPLPSEVRRPSPKGKPSVARTFAEIPVLLIVAAVIAFLVKSLLAQAYYIPSGSMLPQLQIDDRVVVSKLAYKAHDPRRGDIIVFDDPRPGVDTTKTVERTGVAKLVRKVGEGIGVIQPSTDEFIKRVIGLPGDKVEGRDGHVYINGHLLLEPYLKPSVETSDFAAQTVADGKLWVMGDNRTGSADSRVFGQIKVSTIVGRAVVKVWPFSHISFL